MLSVRLPISSSIEKKKRGLDVLRSMIKDSLAAVEPFAQELTSLRLALKAVRHYVHPRQPGDPMGAPTDDDAVLADYRRFATAARTTTAPAFYQFAVATVASLDRLLAQAAGDRGAAAKLYEHAFEPILQDLQLYVDEHTTPQPAELLRERIANFYERIGQSPEP